MSLKQKFLQRSPRERFRLVFLSLALLFASLAFITYYTSVALTYYYNPARNNAAGQVVILTTSWCPFCKYLKASLDDAHMPYTEIDVESNWKSELAFQSTKRHGIPVTIVGSKIVEGGLQTQMAAIRKACEARTQPQDAVDCAKIK
jgi:glutaredoxin